MNFTASLAGVQAHITGFVITDTTRPNSTDIDRWLGQYDAIVALRLGPLDVFLRQTGTLDESASIRTAASKLVELATAADTIDASYPERAGRIRTDLGDVLRTRYQVELVDLQKMVDRRRNEIIAGDTAGTGQAATASFAFPTTTIGRAMNW